MSSIAVPVAGTVVSVATFGAPVVNALNSLTESFAALDAAWATYTPVWSSTGTQPAIGDGAIEGRYLVAGKLIIATGRISMGASTTYGTGTYSVTLPPGFPADSGSFYPGAALAFDNSVAASQIPATTRMNGSTLLRFYSTGGQISPTVPFTWAASDSLQWTVAYATST